MNFSLLSDNKFQHQLDDLLDRTGTKLDGKNFIQVVSNVYHQAESESYDISHDEIIEAERIRLRSLYSKIEELPLRPRVVDLGCGTGHASQILLDFLKENDSEFAKLICVDPSPYMLSKCQEKLLILDKKEMVQGYIDDIDSTSKYDLIITSSVLHHIPNIYEFALKISDLLCENGSWVMSHEPLEQTSFMNSMRSIFNFLGRFQRRIKKRLFPTPQKVQGNDILNVVADKLVAIGITPRHKLTPRELRGVIDIHTPKHHPGNFSIGYEGFNIQDLQIAYGKFGLSMDDFSTYNFFIDNPNRSFVNYFIENLLSFIFPKSGQLFSCIWHKRK